MLTPTRATATKNNLAKRLMTNLLKNFELGGPERQLFVDSTQASPTQSQVRPRSDSPKAKFLPCSLQARREPSECLLRRNKKPRCLARRQTAGLEMLDCRSVI